MSATETQIRAWVKASGRNWDQQCAALCYQICAHFGSAPRSYLSANAARAASKIVSTNASSAPAAAFHFWSIGTYGHVAVGLGGSRVIMGSKYVDTMVGNNAGITTVGRYSARTGARYLGWSYGYGACDFTFKKPTATLSARQSEVKVIAKYLNKQGLGRTTTAADDGVAGTNFYWLEQTYGKKNTNLYGAGFVVDGKNGNQTKKVDAYLVKKLT